MPEEPTEGHSTYEVYRPKNQNIEIKKRLRKKRSKREILGIGRLNDSISFEARPGTFHYVS